MKNASSNWKNIYNIAAEKYGRFNKILAIAKEIAEPGDEAKDVLAYSWETYVDMFFDDSDILVPDYEVLLRKISTIIQESFN